MQTRNKIQNIKTLKGTRPENLSGPKLIGPETKIDPKNKWT